MIDVGHSVLIVYHWSFVAVTFAAPVVDVVVASPVFVRVLHLNLIVALSLVVAAVYVADVLVAEDVVLLHFAVFLAVVCYCVNSNWRD